MKFEELNINKDILKSLDELGFEKPTEIQEKTIPLVISGKDVVAGSATGSGKTLAFGAGIIQNTIPGKLNAIILVPTRELAEQVSKSLKSFAKYNKVKITEVYGGVSLNPQTEKLRTAQIVVGTPGRVLDHMERGSLKLDDIDTFVLDEADRMVDMGFIIDVEKILKASKNKKQMLMFSATISKDLKYIMNKYMNTPVKVNAEKTVDPKKLKQIYYSVDDRQKFSVLVHLLHEERSDLVMVFCNTRVQVDFIAKNLRFNDVKAQPIHGGLTQAKRNQMLEEFHTKKAHVLVCTDVAARGLDIKEVSHVYNYDLPNDSKEYIHRIGRTARSGSEGIAVNILAQRDFENFNRILDDNQGMNIEKLEVPEVPRAKMKIENRNARGSQGRGSHGKGRAYGNRNGETGYSPNSSSSSGSKKYFNPNVWGARKSD